MQISAKRSVSSIDLSELKRPSTAEAGPSGSLETRVTLSSTAREQPTTYRPAAAQSLASKAAHADPKAAEQMAHEFAYTEDSIGIDASDWVNSTGPARVKATGEPYTPEFEAKFKAESAKVREQRIALYESEKAHGTLAADILDKLESMFKELPQGYQDLVRSKSD